MLLETYRVDSVLELCKKYNITDARIYLLETLDRYCSCFDIITHFLLINNRDNLETHSKSANRLTVE